MVTTIDRKNKSSTINIFNIKYPEIRNYIIDINNIKNLITPEYDVTNTDTVNEIIKFIIQLFSFINPYGEAKMCSQYETQPNDIELYILQRGLF